MEPRYERADSGNLPKVNGYMVAVFFQENPDFIAAEMKNKKTAVSGRDSYGDDSIGYVQLHREQGICTVKCKICPEHKVRKKPYDVTLVVDENDSKVIRCQCHDCAASAGGCKHAVAFLMWVHRRSEDPACTSVECYWKKPKLSTVGSTLKYITVEQMSSSGSTHRHPTKPDEPSSSAVYDAFIAEGKKRKLENCELIKCQAGFKHTNLMQYSLHCIFIDQQPEIKANADKMLSAMKMIFTERVRKTIEKGTRKQNKSHMWYEMRYGHITASKAYESSVCRTPDGTLIACIMGAKLADTAAMARGRNLELSVRNIVSNKLKKKIKSCGLFICSENPIIAASPDGITEDAVIEIKCPTSGKAKENYIKNERLSEKCKAQVQLQMHAAGVKLCYFCVADNTFEETQDVDIQLVQYDVEYINELVMKLEKFWKNHIFPVLLKSTS